MTHRTRDQILSVDLTSETVEREEIPQRWLREYLGGKGLGVRYLYDRLDGGTAPLDADNVIAFMTGPLSGYFPGEPRYAVLTKSPLTGGFLDSYSGGEFANRLSGSLDDCLGILVTGRAERPVRLEIEGGGCRIEPTDNWGLDTVETAAAFPDGAVACIGPAGENGVAYATVASDGGEHHAGRGGAGTVMGDKNLKAIVARDQPPDLGPTLRELRNRYRQAYADHGTGQWQAAGGTFESVDFANEIGALSTEGWQRSQFDDIEGISIEAATEAATGRESGAVPGDFRFETAEGDVVVRGAAPMTLGAGLGIDDVEAVARLAESCDRLGVDIIDAGNTIAWAIRANEVGLVGCPIEFGDVDGADHLIEAIAARGSEGYSRGRQATERDDDPIPTEVIGALAEGVDAAADRFGGADLIPTVKSMALPSYDPRRSPGMALAYATSDRGACHRRARPIEVEGTVGNEWSIEDTVRTVVGEQTVRSALWSLIIDDFVGEAMWEDLGSEWLGAIGRSYTPAELTRVGERIWTLTRLFNVREGFDRSADSIPAELLHARDDAGAKLSVDPEGFEKMLDAYYQARGWGPNGVPTRETVDRLDLLAVVDGDTPLGDAW